MIVPLLTSSVSNVDRLFFCVGVMLSKFHLLSRFSYGLSEMLDHLAARIIFVPLQILSQFMLNYGYSQ